MRSFFLFVFLLPLTGFSQAENCGTTVNPVLTPTESAYFDSIFAPERGDFSFQGKTAAFATGNYAAFGFSKMNYFKDARSWYTKHGTRMHEELIVLTLEEQLLYPHYDLLIVTWSKVPVREKNRAKFLKKYSKAKKPWMYDVARGMF